MKLTLDLVRKAISSKPEFTETDKGEYIIFDYTHVKSDSFEGEYEEILRECRGLTYLKKDHKFILKYHKFFNVNENRFFNLITLL